MRVARPTNSAYDARMSEEKSPSAPLATSRPWLSVAGCLGGGAIAGFLAVVVLALVALLVFFPQLFGIGGGARVSVVSAVGELRKSPALKVATREIAVVVDASRPTEITVRPWLVPVGPGKTIEVGRTKAQIVVPGNIVQYVVPLDELGSVDTSIVEEGNASSKRRFIVVLPPPRVDESLVEVQSDPAKRLEAIDRDWLDHIVGDDSAKDAALASVRRAVVEAARAETPMFEVREKARATVAEMIRALLPPEHRDVTIAVRWADDAPDADR